MELISSLSQNAPGTFRKPSVDASPSREKYDLVAESKPSAFANLRGSELW